jgi:large subunit ribosomal protein L22
MAGYKTNEREGTRAVLRHARVSPYKVREVLDLVRGKPVHEAEDILRFSERDAAIMVGKVLHSAVANAENNDELDPEELYVASCFADEGTTIKRWRPRARGRATRIRKRTSHITVIVGRMPLEELQRQQARRRAEQLAQRARRVAGARRAEGDQRSRAERRHGGPAVEEPEAELIDEAPAAEIDEAGGPTRPRRPTRPWSRTTGKRNPRPRQTGLGQTRLGQTRPGQTRLGQKRKRRLSARTPAPRTAHPTTSRPQMTQTQTTRPKTPTPPEKIETSNRWARRSTRMGSAWA